MSIVIKILLTHNFYLHIFHKKGSSNETIVRTCHPLAPQAVIMATADSTDQIARLKRVGANEVLLPYSMIGDALAGFVEKLTKSEEPSGSPEN